MFELDSLAPLTIDLDDGRTVSLAQITDGRVLTHRLSAHEIAADMLDAGVDLFATSRVVDLGRSEMVLRWRVDDDEFERRNADPADFQRDRHRAPDRCVTRPVSRRSRRDRDARPGMSVDLCRRGRPARGPRRANRRCGRRLGGVGARAHDGVVRRRRDAVHRAVAAAVGVVVGRRIRGVRRSRGAGGVRFRRFPPADGRRRGRGGLRPATRTRRWPCRGSGCLWT